MSTARIRRRAVVRGRVQGVGFRVFAEALARQHDLAGDVKNTRDGDVEVHVEGDPGAVDAFIAGLHNGPPAARVSAVEVSDEAPTGERGFRITHG